MRSLLPLPITRRVLRSGSRSSTSRPASSPTRTPVAYNSSTMARSRRGSGPPSAAADSAPATSRRTCAWCSTPGSDFSRLGAFSRRAGVSLDAFLADRPGGEGPGRGRAAAQRGAGHAGFALGAEPAPQGAELQPGKILDAFRRRVAQQASDVGQVGAHGVGRPAAFRLQIPGEVRCGGGQRGRQFL